MRTVDDRYGLLSVQAEIDRASSFPVCQTTIFSRGEKIASENLVLGAEKYAQILTR